MRRASLVPYLSGGGAILCWATLAASIGESLRDLAPETLLFWGLLIAGIALTGWEMLRNRRMSLTWPGWRGALFGIFGIWGYHTLLVLAFAHAPHMEANILNYTWTLWIVMLGSLLPGHRFTGRILAGGLFGFAGVALVIGGDRLLGGRVELGGYALGFALALAASLTWSSFTVFLRLMVPGGRENMALFCLLAAGMALGFLLLRGAPLGLALEHLPGVAFFGLVPLGLSFALWERAALQANMQILGLMSFFTPVLSTLMLALVSGAAIAPTLYGGLALILAGAWLGGRGVRG